MTKLALILVLLSLLNSSPRIEAKSLLDDLFNTFFGSERGSRSATHPTTLTDEISDDAHNGTLPRIWLTVASVVDIAPNTASTTEPHNSSVFRALEVHWNAGKEGPGPGDYLELYSLDFPGSGRSGGGPIRRFVLRDLNNRTLPKYIKTDIEFPYLNQSQLDTLVQTNHFRPYNTSHGTQISGRCLHFYLIYIQGISNRVRALTCIHLSSRWMEAEFDLIKDRTLEEIMIPGTHDATSFEKYKLNDYEMNVISRFQYTQDENLYAQLAYGIRYLDMRVGAYNLTANYPRATSPPSITSSSFGRNAEIYFREELWMVHDINRNHVSLRAALGQVRRFLERTTHEIVIVDFHRFVNGFDEVDDLHALQTRLKHFHQIVVEQLGPFLIPYSANRRATIGQMVAQGRRVILGYQYKYDPRGLFDSDHFWPAVEHLWANTDHFATFESFMKTHICRKIQFRNRGPNSGIHLQSMMAELTPSVEGIIFLRYHGLRELAAQINSHYNHWFRRRFWKCSNIVAADFFLGSELVQIAIDVNRRRFSNATTSTTSLGIHR